MYSNRTKGVNEMIISKIMLETHLAKKCMTYSELSYKSGISRITIQKIVNGRTDARPITIGKIAKALNVNVEELIETEAATSNQFNKDSESK